MDHNHGFPKIKEGASFPRDYVVVSGDGEMQMTDEGGANEGHPVIARIPTSIAGPPHYATASEVATINFLRDVLGMPVPKILAYSTSADNPFGAEYIIMECVQGESLATRWLSLTTEEVKHVMTQVALLEHKISSFRFPGFGSLYHSHDVEPCDGIPPQEEGYCIGPVAKREFWCDGRDQMEVNHGLWFKSEDCVTSYLEMRQYLIHQTGYPWDADLINLRAAFIGVTSREVWDSISPHPCPVTFPQEEQENSDEDRVAWIESADLLSTIRNDLGIDLEGGTTPENFERASRGIPSTSCKWYGIARHTNESYVGEIGLSKTMRMILLAHL